MKTLQIISWTMFLVGIAFKFMHWPGASMMCLLGCGLIFLFAFIFLFKNVLLKKENKEILPALLHIVFAFITLYLLFCIQFWPNTLSYFYFAAIITAIYFVLFFIKTKPLRFQLPQILLAAYFAVAAFLFVVPTHRIWYAFHMNETLNKEYNAFNYHAWNMYSWYLYTDGKQNEALEANRQAQKALANSSDPTLNDIHVQIIKNEQTETLTNQEVFSSNLQFFEQKILDNTWNDPYIGSPHFTEK